MGGASHNQYHRPSAPLLNRCSLPLSHSFRCPPHAYYSQVERAQRVSEVAQRDYARGNHDEAVVLWSAALTMLEEADDDEVEEAISLRTQLRRSRAAVWQKQGRLTRASEEYAHVIVC